jgi:hypothetical protein
MPAVLSVLRDLSAQGKPVIVQARSTRWRCRNHQCDRRIFAERRPRLATPFARWTTQLAGIVKLFGHGAGGRPSERLMAGLGMPVSDTTILRSVKKSVTAQTNSAVVRVVGVDEWAWRKGTTFGTVIVDLERRQVVELLSDRSAATTADWLKRHPEIEVADAAREGAPQARQIADRFHLLKNLRETIERQLGRFEAPIRESPLQAEDDPDAPEQIVIEPSDGCSEVATQDRLLRRRRDAARQAMFDQIRVLYDAGLAVTEIARKLGLGPRRVYRWVRRIDLPEPSAMSPKPCTPAYFGAFLARSWAEGTTKVRHLFSDIRHRGYTGSYSHLARFLASWRNSSPAGNASEPSALDQEAHAGADAGPDDGPSDLAADRGGTLRETSRPDDGSADHQRRRAQGGVGGFHNDARVGNALPGPTSRQYGGAAGHLAERRPGEWHLRHATLCQDIAAGH